MRRVKLVTNRIDTELHALLDLRGARTFQEFWQSVRQVLHSALHVASAWFAPSPDWLPPCAAFRAGTAFESETEFQRFQRLHPLKAFLETNPDKPLATFSDALSDACLLKSRFYREFMAPQRKRFSVVLAFRQDTVVRALIGLTRLQNDRDFSPAELRTLAELHRHFGAALQRVYELQREQSVRSTLELLLAPLPLAIAVFDWNLDVVYSNEAAKQSAALWLAGNEAVRRLKKASRFEVPGELREVCGDLKKRLGTRGTSRGRLSASSIVTVDHRSLPGLQASVRLVDSIPRGFGLPLFVVVFQNMPVPANLRRPKASRFSQLARLSVREREVALLVCTGDSNKEVASKLGKSVLTVKAQLQSIYAKLGIVGRGRMASLIFER